MRDSKVSNSLPWHSIPAEDVLQRLRTDPREGLSGVEAARRLAEYGPNTLKEAEHETAFRMFLRQFSDLIIWVLIGAAVIAGFLGEWVDTGAIMVIVLINAILGFAQEYRAEKALLALRRMTSPMSRVRRDGTIKEIASGELVPGDLVELSAGDRVPADGRIIRAESLRTDEASLTGESVPVEKSTGFAAPDASLGDRTGMVYMGTPVVYGRGTAVLTTTGMDTELGKIAGLVQSAERETTPLQRHLQKFGVWLVYLCFAVVGVVFVAGLLRDIGFVEMFLTSVSLAVAAIPEGLPAVVTLALALGVQRMVKRHALVRRLPSVETLGAATVICTDKTGTLTRNEMTVRVLRMEDREIEFRGEGYRPEGDLVRDGRNVSAAKDGALELALTIMAACNDAVLEQGGDGEWRILGDPTEGALLTAAAKGGVSHKDVSERWPRVAEFPFDSERKRMSTVHRGPSGVFAFVKGSAEMVLPCCQRIGPPEKIRPLTEEARERILETDAELAGKALRVLALAYRPLETGQERLPLAHLEQDLVYLGLVAMIDPPRPEAREAIGKCKRAGIRTVMVTGDHRNTAFAIGRELGLVNPGDEAVSGAELERMSEEDLDRIVAQTTVYARVSAEHKLRIVAAWQKRGDIVAVTGDGVNDAPAIKKADIGVAMGITGTEVTKEASDMVITDDNFASIVAAVEEGRGIYANIRKFVLYLLSCNVAEILFMLVGILARWPIPLWPVQILWMNLVTDGLPALALGVDPPERDLMSHPPRRADAGIVDRRFILKLLFLGVVVSLGGVLAYWFGDKVHDLDGARTFAFFVLVTTQLVHSFNCRSERISIFKIGILTNTKLVGACLLSLSLTLGIIYIPFLQPVFHTRALSPAQLGLGFAISLFPLVTVEIRKFFKRLIG